MERKTRFELATSSLARRHSTAELLPHAVNTNIKQKKRAPRQAKRRDDIFSIIGKQTISLPLIIYIQRQADQLSQETSKIFYFFAFFAVFIAGLVSALAVAAATAANSAGVP